MLCCFFCLVCFQFCLFPCVSIDLLEAAFIFPFVTTRCVIHYRRKERELEEEEEAYERRKLEKKLREKEAAYQEVRSAYFTQGSQLNPPQTV